jgi:hypothetical protein
MANTSFLTTGRDTTVLFDPKVDWLWCEGTELVTNGDDAGQTAITWTGDDPDSWTVVETGATADVTEDAEGIQLIAENGVQEASITQAITGLDAAKKYIFKAFFETRTAGSLAAMLGQDPTDATVAGNMGMTFATAGNDCRIGQVDQNANANVSAVALQSAATDGVLQTISLKEALTSWYPQGRRVHSIQFIPGANNDILVMQDLNPLVEYAQITAINAPIVYYTKGATGGLPVEPKYFNGQRIGLFLNTRLSTLSAGSYIIINWAER